MGGGQDIEIEEDAEGKNMIGNGERSKTNSKAAQTRKDTRNKGKRNPVVEK